MLRGVYLQIFTVVIAVILLALPTANMIYPLIVEAPLEGAVTERERPSRMTLDSLSDESFQRQLTAWYDQHYGLRATATRLDNSINYYAFRETRPDKPVRVGHGEVLFYNDHFWHYNRHDTPAPALLAFAKLARLVQDRLGDRDMELMILVLPSKMTFYASEFPPNWTLPLGPERERPFNTRLYEPFLQALKSEGVRHVDGRGEVLAKIGGQRELAYSGGGRHLNGAAVCYILDKAFGELRAAPFLQRRLSLPTLDCSYDLVTPPTPYWEEYDLLRLINMWGDHPRNPIPMMKPVVVATAAKPKAADDDGPTAAGPVPPDMLIVGSSFAWRVIAEIERNHAARSVTLFYYNETVRERDAPGYPIPRANSPAWQKLVFEKKLVLLPLLDEYMPYHDADFLMQLGDALGIDVAPFRSVLTRAN